MACSSMGASHGERSAIDFLSHAIYVLCYFFSQVSFSLLFNFFLGCFSFLGFCQPSLASGSGARDNSEHEGGSAKLLEP